MTGRRSKPTWLRVRDGAFLDMAGGTNPNVAHTIRATALDLGVVKSSVSKIYLSEDRDEVWSMWFNVSLGVPPLADVRSPSGGPGCR